MIDEKKLIEDIWKLSRSHITEWETGGILALIERQPQVNCSRREWYQKGYQDGLNNKVRTNADRIRNMSDEELAQFIKCARCDAMYGSTCEQQPYCEGMLGKTCTSVGRMDKGLFKWLQAEVKEVNT